ncbi:DUF3037 domain-containing protein [Hymenobacter sp. ASUV-10]|uniref:DUF3037 domain-containing protein n=1 Tax=Hymenobacter aranciens TaxID=3063996 RepID=A0ABT9BC56_9BACT|nr:DUF3037 domain-containing protein [Hymenobacter sp. ASUV-10]MDO7875823.1 DUF3037 domain-containing protein [Hymenobacter sp. ASUV-10]
MKTYQYQLLHYVHDYLTGEFVNVGIVFFEPQTRFLSAAMLPRIQRVSDFFSDVDGRKLHSVLRHIENTLNQQGKALSEELDLEPINNLEQVTRKLIPKNDAAWQWSDVKKGITMFPDVTFHNLFERLVLRYADSVTPSRPSDDDVWRQTYKKYFDKYRLTSKLYPRVVPTAHDAIPFEQTYQNGALHCYQAVTFDLERPDTVKAKAYKWFGLLNELRSSVEPVHVHFLTAAPAHDIDLWHFVEQKLKSAEGENLKVDVLGEADAELLARNLREYVNRHPTS